MAFNGTRVLSLESRAVRDMLPLDPAIARKLFGDIARPGDAILLESSPCAISHLSLIGATPSPNGCPAAGLPVPAAIS